MTLEKFIELYALQHAHRKPNQFHDLSEFDVSCEKLMNEYGYESHEGLAPPLASEPYQPQAYYILFQPKSASEGSPAPLFIMTHDGPFESVTTFTTDAVICYYLLQGFAVACPNYRGGLTSFMQPKSPTQSVITKDIKAELHSWEEKAKGKLHIVGPQDVHAVAMHLRNLPVIRKDKIFLYGVGCGAMINAHLLAGIKSGKFENIYSGAQLVSGFDYPPAGHMPDNIPLLISHSVNDDTTPFQPAKFFMERVLVSRTRAQMAEEKGNSQIQLFASQTGGHQLIDNKLQLNDVNSESCQDFIRYMQLATRFIHEINETGKFKADNFIAQLKQLYVDELRSPELSERIIMKMMPYNMSLDDLVELYILQKDYHKGSEPQKTDFVRKFQHILTQHLVDSTDELAAPLDFLPDQPQIPFVLYKPARATADAPAPLFIHTHGGPHVHYDKTNPHAEIAYYLSQGFVVVCPNYRGSKPYTSLHNDITRTELEKWEQKAKDKHHILGPEDVHAVAMHMKNLPYIRQDKIFLRGMSFGSFINAHLLAGVKAGKFENIYRGAQLTSGLNYPVPEDMPTDIPILISHALMDNIAPFQDARFFMDKMLLAQHHAMQQGQTSSNIQKMYSVIGDHHLINTSLEADDKSSYAFVELREILGASTNFFINEMTQSGEIKTETPLAQLKRTDPEHHVLSLAQSYSLTMKLNDKVSFPPEPENKSEPEDEDEESYFFTLPEEKKAVPVQVTATLSPTQAHLKLTLGETYSGILKQDLELFLGKHLKPRMWNNVKNIWEDVGKFMLEDSEFMTQIIAMVEHEIAFLAEHPDYMVAYHAGEQAALQLYSFITLWKNMLRGDFTASSSVLNEMRLYDFMTQTFDDIQVFLHKMRQTREVVEKEVRKKKSASSSGTDPDSESGDDESPAIIFNRLPGFPDRALACNPGLTFNHHTTASCSLLWYFTDDRHGGRLQVPFGNEIKSLLTSLNICEQARVDRYIKHFERDQHTLLYNDKHQSIMQQMFIPLSLADEKAYSCQIWGEEFKATKLPFDLSKPSSLQQFRQDPFAFEDMLRAHKKAFTNFGRVPGFGENNFHYSTLIQMRYLHHPQTQVPVKTYIRQQGFFKPFWKSLENMVREDFADFIVKGASIPWSIVNGAESVRLGMRKQLQLFGRSEVSENVLHIIFLQQTELYSGLVENPRKEIYGDVLSLSKENKSKIQEQLGELRFKGNSKTRLFQLCRYLKGYTYYDLLMEAAKTTILDIETNDPRVKVHLKQNYKLVTSIIEQFSTPQSAKTTYLSGNRYHQLTQILHNSIYKHEYDPEKHQFFQEEPNRSCHEDYLFTLERDVAVKSFKDYAYIAKQQAYGDDVSERLKMSY